MSAYCSEGCPDADACVVGYPCAMHPETHDPTRMRCAICGEVVPLDSDWTFTMADGFPRPVHRDCLAASSG